MRCEEVRNQLTDYVIGQIDEPRRGLIDKHLSACEECRTEAEELKILWGGLGSIPSQEPSPELRSRFEIMLHAYEHGLAQTARPSWWESLNRLLSRLWPQRPAIQIALALGLLVIGVALGLRMRNETPVGPATSEVVQLRNELSQLRQMIAVSLMQQQSASERLKGVNWSYRLQQPDAQVLSALLNTLMHDSSINVRLATVDALRQFGDQPVVRNGVVQAIPREESPMVQVALIDLAVDLRERESIGTLQQLAQDKKIDPSVRERAERGLAELE
jgi:hypothetical protein